jgi:hypothetical protein
MIVSCHDIFWCGHHHNHKFSTFNQILSKSHTLWSHDTSSIAARPFHITPMGPMKVLGWPNSIWRPTGIVSCHDIFWCGHHKKFGIKFSTFNQILSKSHTLWSHDTSSIAARPLHIIPMGPMKVLGWSNSIWRPRIVSCHDIFWCGHHHKFSTFNQILSKSHTLWNFDTSSIAARPFHITPMGPMKVLGWPNSIWRPRIVSCHDIFFCGHHHKFSTFNQILSKSHTLW